MKNQLQTINLIKNPKGYLIVQFHLGKPTRSPETQVKKPSLAFFSCLPPAATKNYSGPAEGQKICEAKLPKKCLYVSVSVPKLYLHKWGSGACATNDPHSPNSTGSVTTTSTTLVVNRDERPKRRIGWTPIYK